MEKIKAFTYSWYTDDNEKEITIIRSYCIDENGDTVCVRISDFTPFIYIELPDTDIRGDPILWTSGKAQILGNKLNDIMGQQKPIKKNFMYKKRLYYAHLEEGKRKTFPYLFLTFSNVDDIRSLSYKIRKPIIIAGIGNIKVKMHEQDASPILQFTCLQNIPTAGWINFAGIRVHEDNKITSCKHEFKVKWKNVGPVMDNKISKPKIMSFDIEVNSTNPSAMPNSSKPGDKIFQISCIFARPGDPTEKYDKYLLTLGEPDQKMVGEDVEIYMYDTESDLLTGYTDFIQEHNPNVIVGYNILNFDIPYMIARANFNLCMYDFDQQGFTKFVHSPMKEIKWSSSAYKNQEFHFLDAEGRLFVDLLPLVQRDYKFSNYRLKTISTFFLGHTKDDLSVKGIFKCYRIGMKGGPKANKAMGIVGKYCMKDSLLVMNLVEKLQIWIGLCEMAKTCHVPIFVLYTQGQQIKVFSQVYKKCMYSNYVVEKDGYVTASDEHFVGATVFDPIPGVYDRVCPFDFCSLYPTTIIAYNICWSTLVTDTNIPDRKCHVMEWSDHCGCIVIGSKITLNGHSLLIENLQEYKGTLLAYNEDKDGLSQYNQTNFFNQGIKECLELTFEDGSTLQCTPDHKILLSDKKWVETRDIIPNNDKVCVGYSPPIFDMKDSELIIDDFNFTGKKLMIFYKLLGLIITDGHINKNRSVIYTGHQIDKENIINDLKYLYNKVEFREHKENYGWGIYINGKLGKLFRNLPGILYGKKSNQTRTLPTLLEDASKGELCCFFSGLFGGDGHTFRYSKKAQQLTNIALSWTSENKEQLTDIMETLQKYLLKCDINSKIWIYKKETYLKINMKDVFNFKYNIGFSYCVHKSMRLEVGCSYLQLRDNVWEQQKWLVNRVKELKNTKSIENSTKQAIKELKKQFPIYNQYYSNPTKSQMTELLRPRKKWKKPMFSYKYFPEFEEYATSINGYNLFSFGDDTKYGVHIDESVLPILHKKLIHVKSIGKQQVYDLEVDISHSFIANGIVVHNCEHDPKVIRKIQLGKYISVEREKMTKLRKDRDEKLKEINKQSTKYKLETKDKKVREMLSKKCKKKLLECKQKCQDKIDKLNKDLKPYSEEKSSINTKPKHIMCADRKYRWIKEPKGVLPTILQNLLDARKKTRKEIKVLQTRLKTETLSDIEIININTLITVLDKRQQAYKVSANSMYGAMGVIRGYLPFMPGAMATTYMGRVNINIVSKVIPEKYGGKLIYGDSVTEDTPVLCKINGKIYYRTIDNLRIDLWLIFEGNDKEYAHPKNNLEIWTEDGFTKVKKIIRHKTNKEIYRVLTHTGVVDSTEDHGLLDINKNKISPKEIKKGTHLLTHDLPTISTSCNMFNKDYAFVMGLFYADGSCAIYKRKSGSECSTWSINNADRNLLVKCKNILNSQFDKLQFEILETMESSAVLKLVPIGKCIKDFTIKWRSLFYDIRKYKKVPDEILWSDSQIRQSFLDGYYAGDRDKDKFGYYRFDNKGKIGAAGLYYLANSLGYNVSINTRQDKMDVYRLTCTKNKQRKSESVVKKIISLGSTEKYVYDLETENHHFSAGIGKLIVHNTDSNYIVFPEKLLASECWDWAQYVATEVSKLFPHPIELEFENVIYWRYLILTKKRYMSLECLRDGVVSDKISKKGVLLARRDNCQFIRDIYSQLTIAIFNKVPRDEVIHILLTEIQKLCSGFYSYDQFIVTKSVGAINNLTVIPFIDEKDGKKKGKVGDYTVPLLSSEPEKREHQFKLKDCNTSREYYLRCLNAPVQLAQKMKTRGQQVDAGSRLEYVITTNGGHKAKQYIKVEDSVYFKNHRTVLRIDYLYYLKLLFGPGDQLLNVAYFGKETEKHTYKYTKNIVLEQYKFHSVTRRNVLDQLTSLFKPTLIFE